MANENPATHEVVESEVIESVPVGEEANRSSNLWKNVGIVVLILACIFTLVLAFAPKSPPEQANKIAEDNGYELIADDTVRSDSIAQGCSLTGCTLMLSKGTMNALVRGQSILFLT